MSTLCSLDLRLISHDDFSMDSPWSPLWLLSLSLFAKSGHQNL